MRMTPALRAFLRPARRPGPLHRACAALLAGGLLAWSGAAAAATISNTATVTFTGPAGFTSQNSNTTTLTTAPALTPAVVTFYQYAPGAAGSSNILFDGGFFDSTGAGGFSALGDPVSPDGAAIPLTAPVEVRATGVYRIGEPVFITLADGNRNGDPALRETIELAVTTSAGDSEILRLQETGPDTGVFAAVLPSVDSTTPQAAFDGRLTLQVGSVITVNYQDPADSGDTSTSAALVVPVTGLVLQKQVSRQEAAAGDFLQYRLTLRNSTASAASAIVLSDRLPAGMRFESGSLRLDGVPRADPGISADGRSLTLAVGSLAPDATLQISYVVQLGAGVVAGSAVNTATARTPAGLVSNTAQVAVRIREPLMNGAATLVGRVFEGDCHTPWQELKGLAKVRVMLEDGTYAVTDRDGQYHFEGVQPGTHVVQLDVDSLPEGVEPLACIENTRFAGRAFSQFVDVKGGALWRADFHTRARRGAVAIRMQSRLGLQEAVKAPVAAREIGQGPGNVKDFTLRAEFDSCRATLQPAGEATVEALVEELSGADIQRIEVVGNTDDQPLSARCRQQFQDNYKLSEARARSVGEALAESLYLEAGKIRYSGRGPDAPLAGNKTAEGRARNRRTEVRVYLNQAADAAAEKAAATTVAQVTGMQHRIEVEGGSAVGNMKVMAMLPDDAAYHRGSARVDGRPVPDPVEAEGLLTFGLGKPATGASRVIEFDTYPLAPRAAAAVPLRRYTLRARFESCSSDFHAAGRAAVEALIRELRQEGRIEHVELVGHSDNQALSPRCRQRYADNRALAQARARAAGSAIAAALGLGEDQVEAQGRGADEAVSDNATAAGRARNRRIEISVRLAEDLAALTSARLAPVDCPARAYAFKALARFEADGNTRQQTPLVETRVGCPGERTPTADNGNRLEDAGERRQVDVVQRAAAKALPAELQARVAERAAIADAPAAGGADRDWFAGQGPGVAWLFPETGHNPRSPAVRIAIQHLPGQSVSLTLPGGAAVSGLNFDGVLTSPDRRMQVSLWRGVPLAEGDNAFTADVRDSAGRLVETLTRSVHYSGAPVRAVLLPEKSLLLADGLNRPMLALRFLDRDGRPVRAGVGGTLRLNAPYRAWQAVEQEQKRQLAGRDRFEPRYQVEGDDGIAYIELAPTTESGSVQLELAFQLPDGSQRRQQLRAWLEPEPRDWVLVGFAAGTLGYDTLKGNSQSLAGGTPDGGYSDGQVSLYAKGRVLGKWLLTLAYATDKARDRRQSLLGTIDPNEYYTLYGDGAEQRHDAPSQEKLYLKLERGQFYALFGDYATGLTQTQLSRYNRTLNGVKSENAGGPLVFTVFAAETPQTQVRDELQGDGTSGLYRLRRGNLVLNSETIRLETRDRLHAERILESRALTRHSDYDIDYANGTLFFRQPLPSRDPGFNPVFIVAEYETLDAAADELNAGGRVGVNLKEGRVQAGVTGIRDESYQSRGNLVGADLRLKLGEDSEVRVEVAETRGRQALQSPEGMAWLSEYEHHGGRYDALLYARRQEADFGRTLATQSAAETGMQKVGAEGQLRLAPGWSVKGQLYQQENLLGDVRRDAAAGSLQYKNDGGGFSLGAQAISDRAGSGALADRDFRSEQATAAANRFFLKRRLELSAQAETGFGGRHESVDFPDRYLAGASYALTDSVRLLAGQEFSDGYAFNTRTTRVGLQVTPWQGARLDSTLNQSEIGEYGPRTFAQFGMTQGLLLNARWGMDVSVDSSQTLKDTGRAQPVLNAEHPVAPGGHRNGPGLTEDFVAVSTGATYRAPVWSWNGRVEDRNGESVDRYGMVSHFLRQAQAGVAFASAAQLFRSRQDSGGDGWLGSVDVSWAWRPLGVQWSLLDRLELRYEELENGSGGGRLFGNNGLAGHSASSRRLINNFALNRVSREWQADDRQGNLFRRYERNQWSLYYGAKYVLDSFDGAEYDGYTDLLGLEVRHDLRTWLDLGLQASSLNSWSRQAHAYSFGPQVGVAPVANGWITLGWNLRGFRDNDFDAARYTAEGPYLQLRFKFDQHTRLRDFTTRPASAQHDESTVK
ncbi:MAG: OmpA family protein [Pseudomonadota bacterium]